MKKIILFLVLALIAGTGTAHALPTAYAVSYDNIYNGTITLGTGISAPGASSDSVVASTDLNGSGTSSSTTVVGTAVQSAQGSPTQAIGTFTSIGLNLTSTYTTAGAEIITIQNPVTGVGTIQAVNKAESNINPPNSTADANGTNNSTTLILSTIVLDSVNTLTFDFWSNAYMQALVTADAAIGSTATATLVANVTITPFAGGDPVFSWSPNGAPGGITGGTELLDPFNLNTNVNALLPGQTQTFDQSQAGVANVGILNLNPATFPNDEFKAVTNSLAAGTYNVVLTLKETSNVQIAVPEPGTILLIGAGLLAIVAIAALRRKTWANRLS